MRPGSNPGGGTNYIMENDMGKHIKTQLDYDMIEQLAQQVFQLDPNNVVLQKYLKMDNFEGSELRKCLKQ